MPEEEPKLVSQRVYELYPDYMMMIRTFVTEGMIELDEPTEQQQSWANRASLGDPQLARNLGKLAQVTDTAFKQRFLEGMPMLIDFDTPVGGGHNGFETAERLHFIRLFAKDLRQLGDGESPAEGVPVVFYQDPSEL